MNWSTHTHTYAHTGTRHNTKNMRVSGLRRVQNVNKTVQYSRQSFVVLLHLLIYLQTSCSPRPLLPLSLSPSYTSLSPRYTPLTPHPSPYSSSVPPGPSSLHNSSHVLLSFLTPSIFLQVSLSLPQNTPPRHTFPLPSISFLSTCIHYIQLFLSSVPSFLHDLLSLSCITAFFLVM